MVSAGPPTRRTLGIGYLLGVGVIFAGMVLFEFASGTGWTPEEILSLSAGLLLASGLIVIGVWLSRSSLEETRILTVSEWAALGMAIPTTIILVSVLGYTFELSSGLLSTLIAGGGIVGALGGTVTALESEHRDLDHLYHRNKVLQRVLRHNIRNGITVVQGYADLLEEALEGGKLDMIEQINQEARTILELSEKARNLDSIEDGQSSESVDVAEIIAEVVEILEMNYEAVSIETSIPDHLHVRANHYIELAVWELLEYAIRQSDGSPVTVGVNESEGESTLFIRENSSQLPEGVVEALERGNETQLQHLEGMELWVAKWLVENMDGSIEFDRLDPIGMEVRIVLPATG